MDLTSITLMNIYGNDKTVGRWHPCHDALENKRVRIHRIITETQIEVADNDGRVLPDYRHPTQLQAY